jgi:hypothetical protein
MQRSCNCITSPISADPLDLYPPHVIIAKIEELRSMSGIDRNDAPDILRWQIINNRRPCIGPNGPQKMNGNGPTKEGFCMQNKGACNCMSPSCTFKFLPQFPPCCHDYGKSCTLCNHGF